jgi:hypothetical protein
MSATTSDRHSNPLAHRVRRQRLAPSLLIEKRLGVPFSPTRNGHASVQTTERYIGSKQKLQDAVNDRLGTLIAGETV